jgi:hypothetical protein
MTRGNGVLATASRVINPRRATAFVALAAVAALAASQLIDYRAVEIGASQYKGVSGLGPPVVAAATPRSAHGDWVLAICGVALLILVASAWLRRPALTRFLVLLGGGAVAIALAVDRPHGLRVGSPGVAYQGAKAVLLSGYGAEVAAAATLAFAGFALPLQAGGAAASRRRRAGSPRARREPRPARRSPLEAGPAGG